MSLWRDELKPNNATVACLVVLVCVAVASLSRVIDAPAYLSYAIAAVVIGAAFALYFGFRSLALGFGLLIVTGAATLPVVFVRGPKTSALPTPAGFSALRKLISSGITSISKTSTPVPAQPKFLVLVWLGLLLLGFLSAAWIVVRRPVGAVVSLLALVTFTGSVGDGPGRNVYALLAIAATGGFFLSEGRHRIARWGGGRISIPLWLGIPTLVAACVVALGAPIVFGEQPILRLDSAIRPRIVIIKPLSDIRRQLKVDPPLEVLRVESRQPTYWRLTGLDRYDGHEWILEAKPRDVREGFVPAPNPATTGEILEQKYQLTSLLAPWLPAAFAASSVNSTSPVQIDLPSQTLLLRDNTKPGLHYTVRSRLPKVTVNQPQTPRKVDDNNAKLFGNIARPLVAGAKTPLDEARRLEAHFRKYRYNDNVPAGHTVARLQKFLKDRTGYCEQFAATMTLMLRGLGVEARVGVGFLPGALSGGQYIVSTRDAHAWVEANLPGVGWTAFDPTPGRGDASTVPPQLQESKQQPQPVPQVTTVPAPTPIPENGPQDVTSPKRANVPAGVLWGVLALAILAAVPTAKSVRRSRRRRCGIPDVAVAGAYTELIDRARDLGWRPRPSETQREFVRRALAGDEPATVLALLVARALYGPGRTGPEDVGVAWNAERAAATALRRRSPWWRQSLAMLDPRTFLPDSPLRSLRARVASAFGRS